MSRALTVVLLLLIAVGFGAWFALRGPALDPASPLEGSPALQPDSPRSVKPLATPGPGAEREAVTEPEAAAVLRVEIEDAAGQDESSPAWVRARVVGTDGEPRAGIGVQIYAVVQGLRIGVMEERLPKTDAAGLAVLPPPKQWERRVAVDGASFEVGVAAPESARLPIHPDAPPSGLVELVMGARDEPWYGAVAVQVVLPSGEPAAGIPVAWTVRAPGEKSDDKELVVVQSDSSGRADLPLDEWRAQHEVATILGTVRLEHVFRGVLFGADTQPLRVSNAALLERSEPYVLEVPAYGSLAVRVLGPAGEELPEPGSVASWWRPSGAPASANYSNRASWYPPRETAGPHAGAFMIGPVALGTELLVRAFGPGRAWRPGELELVGPTRLGEVVPVEIRVGELYPFLLARVLRADGQPLADTSVLWTTRGRDLPVVAPTSGSRGYNDRRQATDARGELRLRYTGPLSADEPRVFEVLLSERAEGAPRATVDLPDPIPVEPGGEYDLGELVLSPAAPAAAVLPPIELVQVRVIDATGGALEKARITCSWWRGNQRVLDAPKIDKQRLGDGTVLYRGSPVADAELWVNAAYGDFLGSGWQKIQPPFGQLLEIELGPAGLIEGRLLVDDGIPTSTFEVKARCGESRAESMVVGGWLRVGALEPGEASLVIEDHDTEMVFAELSGITIGEDGACDDPRLDPLDLRGTLLLMELSLRRSDGSALSEERIWFEGPERQQGSKVCDSEGRLFLVMPVGAGRFALGLRDHVPVEVSVAAGTQTLTFVPK